MQNSAIKLMFTKIGKNKIASLLENREKAFAEIALGDQYKAFDELDTKLANECTRITATILSSKDRIDRIHIQASLSNDSIEFKLREIGLLLKDKEETSTLVGIYRTETILAIKSANMDLFLDITLQLQDYNPSEFIINLPDYQPIFQLPPASAEKLGVVRLATQKEIQQETEERVLTTRNLATEEIIKSATTGFILTTNHLAALSSHKKNEYAEWSSIKLNEQIDEANDSIEEISFAAPFFMASKNAIYIFYAMLLADDNKQVFFVKYDLQSHTVKLQNISKNFSGVSTLIFSAKTPCCELDGDNLSFYFLATKEGEEKVYQLKIKTIDNKETIVEAKLNKPIEFMDGQLFLYDRKIGSIAQGKIDLLSTDRFGNNEAARKITLNNDLQTDVPIVHTIQDKLYCIGGGDSLIKIYNLHNESYKNKNLSAFTPASTSTIDLSKTEGLTSVLLRNSIYIFKPDTYFKDESQAYDFYCHHILDNQWQTLPFPEKNLLPKKVKFNLGSAITVINDIYLFFLHITEDNITELSVLKFKPFY